MGFYSKTICIYPYPKLSKLTSRASMEMSIKVYTWILNLLQQVIAYGGYGRGNMGKSECNYLPGRVNIYMYITLFCQHSFRFCKTSVLTYQVHIFGVLLLQEDYHFQNNSLAHQGELNLHL